MTQYEEIKQHLEAGRSITQLQATNQFKCLRLAAVVHKLKTRFNVPIHKETIKTASGKRVARYSLTAEQ